MFDEYRVIGEELGFRAVFAGPFVRSSYMADVVAESFRAPQSARNPGGGSG